MYKQIKQFLREHGPSRPSEVIGGIAPALQTEVRNEIENRIDSGDFVIDENLRLWFSDKNKPS